jgi:hypothetical protein
LQQVGVRTYQRHGSILYGNSRMRNRWQIGLRRQAVGCDGLTAAQPETVPSALAPIL